MPYAMFIAANLLFALLFAVYAVVCLRVAHGIGRKRGAERLGWRAAPAVLGLILMEAGVIDAVLGYRPFDPAKTPLQMICLAKGPLATDDPEQIYFRYDPSRRCQNQTFYAAKGGELRRTVMRSMRRAGGRVYETRQLSYRPDFAHPTTRGVFTIVQSTDQALFDRLASTVQGDPILCPAPGDLAAISHDASRQAELDRLFHQAHHAGDTTIRWRCAADPKTNG